MDYVNVVGGKFKEFIYVCFNLFMYVGVGSFVERLC